MGKMSRDKGKRGERLVCKLIKDTTGYDAQRTVQYKGTGSSADIESALLSGWFHPEVKFTESTSFYAWYTKAQEDAGDDARTPLILHKKKNGEWMAFLPADVLFQLIALAKKNNEYPG